TTRSLHDALPNSFPPVGPRCRPKRPWVSAKETSVLAMSTRDLKKIMDSGWAEALEPVAPQITTMGDFLRQEVSEGRTNLPSGDNVLRAFQQPFDDVRVLIVGQDPYPTPGNAVGLSFSV